MWRTRARRVATLACPERVIPLAIVLAVVRRVRHRSAQTSSFSGTITRPGRQLRFPRSRPPAARWMFTTTLMGHYISRSRADVRLDYVLWGMHAGGLPLHEPRAARRERRAVLTGWQTRLLYARPPGAGEKRAARGRRRGDVFSRIHPCERNPWRGATERRGTCCPACSSDVRADLSPRRERGGRAAADDCLRSRWRPSAGAGAGSPIVIDACPCCSWSSTGIRRPPAPAAVVAPGPWRPVEKVRSWSSAPSRGRVVLGVRHTAPDVARRNIRCHHGSRWPSTASSSTSRRRCCRSISRRCTSWPPRVDPLAPHS